MTNNYPPSVEKIVDNYLRRVREHMRGIPKEDREEMLKEMTSHIYEAYSKDPAEDEIDKILNVLQRLGEPAEVIAALGLGMLWLGKRMLRGIRFLFILSWEKIQRDARPAYREKYSGIEKGNSPNVRRGFR